MNLAQPWALALFAFALPLVAAYLHRHRRTPLSVPSAMLFRVIAGQTTPKTRSIAKPRHLVSLLLVLLTLLGLIAALVGLRRDEEQPRAYIVVLDTSASMGAVASGEDRTRLDEANERLADALGELGQQDRVALITAADQATVAVGLTEDHAKIRQIAADQTPAGTSDGTPAALRIADAMCRANEDAAIVLLSDGVGVSAPTTECPVQHLAVGRLGDNLGLSALSVREADALGLAEVYLAVTSDLDEPTEIEVELLLDGELAEVVPFDVPATGQAKQLLRVPLPPGRRVTAKLRPTDGTAGDVLAADDEAWAPRRLGGRVSVLLVTDSRLSFTGEALRLHPRVDLTLIGPRDTAPDGPFDLILLEAPRSPATLPSSGHIAALGAAAPALGFAIDQPDVAEPEIVRWSFEHPLFRFVSFDEVQVPHAAVLAVAEGQTALIDSDHGPLAVADTHGGQQRIAFGFAPHDSDFVLRVGFVNLVANLVEWAAPPVTATGEAAEEFALPASESRIDPPAAIEGTTRGEWTGPVRTHLPLWRLLAWIAAGLLALEWLLPGMVSGWARLAARGLRRRRNRNGGASA